MTKDEGRKRVRVSSWWASHWHVALAISLVVLLSVVAVVLAFRHFSGPAWRIQALLRAEARALEAGDQEAFFSLQDSADKVWWRYQTTQFNSRQWAREGGEAWALEPVPRPRVVSIQLQDEEAWVEVTWTQGGTTRRRAEFFRQVTDEWKHTGPDERFWGSPLETRTEDLRWIYRERDEGWVSGLFDKGEEIYQRVCDDFGLVPGERQVTIEITYSMDELYLPFYPEGPILRLPSPFLIGMEGDDYRQTEGFLSSLLVNYLAVQSAGGDVAKVTGARRAALDAIRDWERWQVSSDGWESYWAAHLVEAIERGELLPLSEVWGESEPQLYALATAQSYTLMDYIVEKYGRKSLSALLLTLGSSPSLEEALQKALGPGFVIEEFEADWLAFVWEEYGPGGTPLLITPPPSRTPTPAPTATLVLSLPTTLQPLPVVQEIDAYRTTMRPGNQHEVEVMADLPHYDLALQVNFENGTLSGRERLIFINQQKEALKDILLRLYPNCSRPGSMKIGGVSIDGGAVDFSYQAEDTAMLVSLPQPLASGESITLEMDFALRLHSETEGVWSAVFFYPLLAVYQDGNWREDALSSGPDAVFSESASYAVELTLPGTMGVAASGMEMEAVDHGDGTVTRSYRGGPLRGFALFMSQDFQMLQEVVDGITVNTWYLPGDEVQGQAISKYATDAVEVFDARFGLYPYAELDVVVIPDTRYPAGMVTGVEYPSLVTVRHGEASDPEFATAHEVAHQWWYGIVGNDVLQEPWLDESFANYATIIYYEGVHGKEAAQKVYQERVLSMYESIRGSDQDGPVGQSIRDFTEAEQPSGPIIYGKGAVFLNMLRHETGDEAFFTILQEYYRRYKYGVATGEDFLAGAEEVAGRELDGLYGVWVRK
jgi:hypothetical protein